MMQIWMSMLTWNAVILERYASTSSLHKATRRRAYMRLVLNPQTPMQVASRGCAVSSVILRCGPVSGGTFSWAQYQPNYIPSARVFLKQIFCPLFQSFLFALRAMSTTITSQEARTHRGKPANTTGNIHFYDENFNDEFETVTKIAFYDENFGFVIDHHDEPRTPLSMTK